MVKHNFSVMMSYDNPVWGAMVEVNNATSHLLAYSIIVTVYVVTTYVFLRRTQDTPKSFLMSTHIAAVLTLILYFAGKSSSITFVDDVFVLGLLVLESLALGGMIYMRHSKNQG